MLPPWQRTALCVTSKGLLRSKSDIGTLAWRGIQVSCASPPATCTSHARSPHQLTVETRTPISPGLSVSGCAWDPGASSVALGRTQVRDWHMSSSLWLSQWVSPCRPPGIHIGLYLLKTRPSGNQSLTLPSYCCAAVNSRRTNCCSVWLGSNGVLHFTVAPRHEVRVEWTTTGTEPILHLYFKDICFKQEKEAASTWRGNLQLWSIFWLRRCCQTRCSCAQRRLQYFCLNGNHTHSTVWTDQQRAQLSEPDLFGLATTQLADGTNTTGQDRSQSCQQAEIIN